MPFPESLADFESLVPRMRALGVIQAFGVLLGPAPVEDKPSSPETPEAKANARQEARREKLRLELAASGREYTDAELDEMLGPEGA